MISQKFLINLIHMSIKLNRAQLATKQLNMVFDIKNKVALVSGGAAGIGLQYTKELLRNGAKGVTIADWDVNSGKIALEEIHAEFGLNRVVFMKTDVTDKAQFEEAFKKTVETFTNVDILINNAGIFDDELWEKEVAVNINGTINGTILAYEKYIPQHKSGSEGLIINISSVGGICQVPFIPIYTGTKFAVTGLTLAFGAKIHFDRTNIRVVGICPGNTKSSPIPDLNLERCLSPAYRDLWEKAAAYMDYQTPEQCAKGTMEVIKKAPTGSMWVIENGESPYEFKIPDRKTFKNNTLH